MPDRMTHLDNRSHVEPKPKLVLASLIGVPGLGLFLSACGVEEAPPAKAPVAVVTQTARIANQSRTVSLTGSIQAETLSYLGFRLSGRIASRTVDVGDRVEKGEILASLEKEQQQADVQAAKAGVQSAQATLQQAQATFQRQDALLKSGNTTRSNFDDANEQLQSARATLDTAQANLETARDNLDNTDLRADASGVLTARNAEAGQVVEAAQTVFALAQDGARDAVFDVYEALLSSPPEDESIEVKLIADPSVRTTGRLREVSPAIDTETGTVRVKLRLSPDMPPEMVLGAAITGTGRFERTRGVALPWTALSLQDGAPTVWIVEPESKGAVPRRVVIADYRTGQVLIGEGLKDGDQVIVAGMQFLSPNEVVEPRPGPERAETQP